MLPPLIVTGDPSLRDELLRFAAAAGAAPADTADPATALRDWAGAALVLVGADLVSEAAALGPPRRGDVHVVRWSGGPDDVFRSALALGAESVVDLPGAEGWLVERLTDVGEQPARGRTVGVVGGAGGAGATTLACALGQVAAPSGPTLVVDTDPLGPGVDRLLGLEVADGIRWDALAQATGRLGSRSLRQAVPGRDGLGMLTWPPGSRSPLELPAVREALSAARRGHDLVVLDLARHQGRLLEELAARCDHLVVVAPATVVGAAATARLLEHLPESGARHLALRRGSVPAADMARATGVPVLVEVPEQRRLAEAVDLGLGPVRSRRSRLARAARFVLDVVAA
jgi:secretion/DNA translocation related CpaE-like protein